MDRKDVTNSTKDNENGIWKKFGLGILGGAVGGIVTFGVFYFALGAGSATPASTPTTTTGNQNSSGEVVTSNVNVDVTSDITDAVSKVQNAVVSVVNLQKQSASLDEWGQLFGQQSEDENSGELQESSEGSGVIYKKDGKDAYIVTNNHVVEGSDGLEVLLADGTKVEATLVGTDVYTDLAVLKVDGTNIDTVAEFGKSSEIKVGEPAIAIGSPLGSDFANSVTSGIISSLNRQVINQTETGQTSSINAIQTDAAINPGNSGGPLINIAGQVIGINSSKIVSSSSVSVEGMGFAIPSDDVVTIINQLEADGKVTRPALGITMVNLSDISSQQQEQILKVPSDLTAGIVVTKVSSASPAEKAGLEQYDVITKIDGEDVSTSTDLQSALYKKKVGDTMEVTFYHQSDEKTVTVELTLDQSALQQENN